MKTNTKQPADFFALYKESAWNKDTESMINLYHDNVVIFDMWNQLHVSGLTEWSGIIKQWLNGLKDENVKVTFEMINIRGDDNISFANALITYQAVSTDNKILRSMTNRITIGLIKAENVWKVIHQHTSAPIDGNLQAIL